ncbi:basic proline-rich protein-like [Agelaius tricolor]|uniref:basic proline-rich protein-like n=1 Tax=Agelaius tricolor TaxID=9191 RepID=UPI0039F1B83E
MGQSPPGTPPAPSRSPAGRARCRPPPGRGLRPAGAASLPPPEQARRDKLSHPSCAPGRAPRARRVPPVPAGAAAAGRAALGAAAPAGRRPMRPGQGKGPPCAPGSGSSVAAQRRRHNSLWRRQDNERPPFAEPPPSFPPSRPPRGAAQRGGSHVGPPRQWKAGCGRRRAALQAGGSGRQPLAATPRPPAPSARPRHLP